MRLSEMMVGKVDEVSSIARSSIMSFNAMPPIIGQEPSLSAIRKIKRCDEGSFKPGRESNIEERRIPNFEQHGYGMCVTMGKQEVVV